MACKQHMHVLLLLMQMFRKPPSFMTKPPAHLHAALLVRALLLTALLPVHCVLKNQPQPAGTAQL